MPSAVHLRTAALALAVLCWPLAGADSVLTDDYNAYHPGIDTTYQLSVSSYSVNLGDSVTVSWSGAQSHPNDYQDWDWIAGFQSGACNASGIAGQDTCYSADEWAWISDQGGSTAGSWSFTFDGPGTYEFRASYCGCDECNDITGDFSSCDGYMQVGLSAPVVVNPPIDISQYGSDVQFVLGMLWVEFEGSVDNMNKVTGQPAPQPSCNTCFCEIKAVWAGMETAVGDFTKLWESFSMAQLQTTIGDVADTVTGIKDAMGDCDVDAIIGSDLTEELMTAAAGLVSGLEEVEMAVKMAINGANIYSKTSNALLGWQQENYFASGVNTAKLLNLLLSTNELAQPDKAAVIKQAAAAANTTSMARRPGGVWVPCSAVPTAHTAVCVTV